MKLHPLFAQQLQINHLKDGFKEGDVILSNHPSAGGSHLPDLTVITPVGSVMKSDSPNKYKFVHIPSAIMILASWWRIFFLAFL